MPQYGRKFFSSLPLGTQQRNQPPKARGKIFAANASHHVRTVRCTLRDENSLSPAISDNGWGGCSDNHPHLIVASNTSWWDQLVWQKVRRRQIFDTSATKYETTTGFVLMWVTELWHGLWWFVCWKQHHQHPVNGSLVFGIWCMSKYLSPAATARSRLVVLSAARLVH